MTLWNIYNFVSGGCRAKSDGQVRKQGLLASAVALTLNENPFTPSFSALFSPILSFLRIVVESDPANHNVSMHMIRICSRRLNQQPIYSIGEAVRVTECQVNSA